ncbi:MAG: DNA/RNA helicase domain-containing protein [Holdemania massiliensis]
MKLITDVMTSQPEAADEFTADEDEFSFQSLYYLKNIKSLKIGLVVPMTSLRKTLKKVFKQVQGLRSSMVIGPSDVIKEHYDVLIVDEAHRLRQKKNLMPGHHKVFERINAQLGLKDGNEWDWIRCCSDYQILFYDDTQTVKPSDIDNGVFQRLVQKENTEEYFLTSQMRVAAGQDYIAYVENILYEYGNPKKKKFKNYEFLLFDQIQDLVRTLQEKEREVGLCRLVAGYAWKWKTQTKLGSNPK